MTIPFIIRSSNPDLYARGLGHAVRSYRLYDPDLALARDPAAYNKMRRDLVIAFALRYRKLLAAGEDWSVVPASARPEDKEVASIVEGMIRQIGNFPNALFNLAEAIIAGSRWASISGDKKLIRLGSQQALNWWVVTDLTDHDKRDFRRVPEDVSAPLSERRWRWQRFRPYENGWSDITRYHFVRHVVDDNEESLGFGTGLASELYFFWWMKEKVLNEGMQFIERWAQGILKAAVDSLRDGQATTLAATRANNWLTELEKMRGRHVLVHDKNDELEVLEAPDSGWQAAKDALAYLDGAMRVHILGASLPTEAEVDGGSFAMAKIQASSTQSIVGHDRALLEETITRDLIRGCLWRLNLPIFQFLGLGDAQPPYFKIRDANKSNPSVNVDIMLKFQQLGGRIKLNEAYEKAGFEVPGANDECLEPPPPPAPGPMMGGGPDINPNGLSPTGDADRPSDKPSLEPERFDKGTDSMARRNKLFGNNPRKPGMAPPGSHHPAGLQPKFSTWNEADHPRDEEGKFTDGTGGSSSGLGSASGGEPGQSEQPQSSGGAGGSGQPEAESSDESSYDADGDGEISPEEMEKAFAEHSEQLASAEQAFSGAIEAANAKLAEAWGEVKEVDKTMKAAMRDGQKFFKKALAAIEDVKAQRADELEAAGFDDPLMDPSYQALDDWANQWEEAAYSFENDAYSGVEKPEGLEMDSSPFDGDEPPQNYLLVLDAAPPGWQGPPIIDEQERQRTANWLANNAQIVKDVIEGYGYAVAQATEEAEAALAAYDEAVEGAMGLAESLGLDPYGISESVPEAGRLAEEYASGGKFKLPKLRASAKFAKLKR